MDNNNFSNNNFSTDPNGNNFNQNVNDFNSTVSENDTVCLIKPDDNSNNSANYSNQQASYTSADNSYNNYYSGGTNTYNDSYNYDNSNYYSNNDSGYDVSYTNPCTWACITGFILALVGFLFNPLGLVSVTAFIFGIIGHTHKGPQKGLGLAAWIVAIISFFGQLIFDLIVTIFSFGLGFVFFFF